MTQTLRISQPADLLGYLPHHLGFQPENSVVALSVRGPKPHVGLAMRIDIADLLASNETGVTPREHLRPHLLDDGAQAAIVVLYTSVNPAAPGKKSPGRYSIAQLRECISALRAVFDSDLPLSGFWIVTPEHYFALEDASDGDHRSLKFPPRDEWHPASELAVSQTAVQAIYRGSTVAPNRAALAEVPRAEKPLRDRAQRAALRWLARRNSGDIVAWRRETWEIWQEAISEQLRAARAEHEAGGHGAGFDPVRDPLVIGRLQAGLDDVQIRDAVLISNIPGIGDLPRRSISTDAREEVGRSVDLILNPRVALAPGIEASAIAEILGKISGHCARSRVAPTLTLLAWIHWWRGDGARASVLAEKALHTDPAYNMARLVSRMVELGMPPGWVKRDRKPVRVG